MSYEITREEVMTLMQMIEEQERKQMEKGFDIEVLREFFVDNQHDTLITLLSNEEQIDENNLVVKMFNSYVEFLTNLRNIKSYYYQNERLPFSVSSNEAEAFEQMVHEVRDLIIDIVSYEFNDPEGKISIPIYETKQRVKSVELDKLETKIREICKISTSVNLITLEMRRDFQNEMRYRVEFETE